MPDGDARRDCATSGAVSRTDRALSFGRVIHGGGRPATRLRSGDDPLSACAGRQRLRMRLANRGHAEPVGVLAAAVPASIVHSTVQTVLEALAGRTSLAAILAPSVTALTRLTVRIQVMPRITLVAALLTTTSVMTAVTIPLVGPFLQARPQTSSTENRSQPDQAASQTIKQEIVLPRDLEEAFYRILKRDHEFNYPDWPFVIKVRDVVGKSLVNATFKHRVKGRPNEFDAVIESKRAVLRFDLKAKTHSHLPRSVRSPAFCPRLRPHADRQRHPGNPNTFRQSRHGAAELPNPRGGISGAPSRELGK